jgi:1-deoxy-D-xylulose-5-phosphate reductoisomerase
LKKRIAIFGSTGSIGIQALEVIHHHSEYFQVDEYFQVELLAANNNAEFLIKQAINFRPNVVVIGNKEKYQEVKEAVEKYDIKVYAGDESFEQVMEMDSIDIVLMAIVGIAALKPTIKALDNHKTVALANKESLVVAGNLISESVTMNQAHIIPVDSELSAIFQCLVGEFNNPVEKIVLTASGGPFRGYDATMLKTVTVDEALNHPTWRMGEKVTVDSATLMNKGLEAIEAKWLFGLSANQIDVLVHPQSVVHSMVYFEDGSVKAQLSNPDMRIPIQYALTYPDRLKMNAKSLDLLNVKSLTFEKTNVEIFRNLALAFEDLEKGGNLPCILNAANELSVQAYLSGQIEFVMISDIIEYCMGKIDFIEDPNLNDYFETDRLTRIVANKIIQTH